MNEPDARSTSEQLSRALTVLAELLAEGKPLRALVEQGGLVAELSVRPNSTEAVETTALVEPPSLPPPSPPPPVLPADVLWLTRTEEAVIGVASPTEWKSSTTLAGDAGVPRDRDFEALLRFMVERGILASATGRGYRLRQVPAD